MLQEAHKRYNKFLSDPELMEAYEGRQKWLHDQATIRDEGFEDGKEEGIMQTVKVLQGRRSRHGTHHQGHRPERRRDPKL